jgi:tripartite-type tricarboxylate transporter receptor subunit TctC
MAVTELAAGDIDFFFFDSTGVQGPAERGQVRMLAVTSPQRLSFAPQVPTMQEEGVKDFDMTSWFAIFAPAHTPKDIRDKLEVWLNDIAKKPETTEFLKRAAADPWIGNPDVLMQTVRSQTDKYRKLSEAGKLPLAAE